MVERSYAQDEQQQRVVVGYMCIHIHACVCVCVCLFMCMAVCMFVRVYVFVYACTRNRVLSILPRIDLWK